MHRNKNSLSKPKTPRAKDNGNLANISVPYYPALSKRLRQISDRHNISLTFTSNRNLRNMLKKTKTQPPPHTTRNVIYQIPCKDCNATYCGQTRRPLHLRLSERQRFTNNSKSFTSTDLQYTSAVPHHAHHDYHPSPLSPHITQHNASQLTHYHINTMTISHSPADDGRKNSSESSCYAYIYCYFYVFTQLYKSLKY